MPGVFEVSRDVPILVAVEDILLISECSRQRNAKGRCDIYRSADAEGFESGSGEVRRGFEPAGK